MLNGARVTSKMREGLWAEAASHATFLENHLASRQNERPPVIKFNGKKDDAFEHVHTFGEMAVVKNHQRIVSKMSNRGKTVMYVGHAKNHQGDMH